MSLFEFSLLGQFLLAWSTGSSHCTQSVFQYSAIARQKSSDLTVLNCCGRCSPAIEPISHRHVRFLPLIAITGRGCLTSKCHSYKQVHEQVTEDFILDRESAKAALFSGDYHWNGR